VFESLDLICRHIVSLSSIDELQKGVIVEGSDALDSLETLALILEDALLYPLLPLVKQIHEELILFWAGEIFKLSLVNEC